MNTELVVSQAVQHVSVPYVMNTGSISEVLHLAKIKFPKQIAPLCGNCFDWAISVFYVSVVLVCCENNCTMS